MRVLDDVTDQLQSAIVSGALRPGDRLPNERELSAAFGIGRPTLREALRVLEALSLLEIRTGKRGGAFVTSPSEESLTRSLEMLVATGEVPLADLTEFRIEFESRNAWWAAEKADSNDIASLRSIASEAKALAVSTEGSSTFPQVDTQWHGAVARATKNSIRTYIFLGFYDAALRHARVLTAPLIESTDMRSLVASADSMARITELIANGDNDKAEHGMRLHIEHPGSSFAE